MSSLFEKKLDLILKRLLYWNIIPKKWGKMRLKGLLLSIVLTVLLAYAGLTPQVTNTAHVAFSIPDPDSTLIQNPVRAIWPDYDNTLFFATARGLAYQDADSLAIYRPAGTVFTQDSQNNMHGILTRGTDLVVATAAGMWVLDSADTADDTLYSEPEGLADSVVYSFALDDSSDLWIGTIQGPDEWQGDSLFVSFADSVPGVMVYDIAKDSVGGLWFATNKGVALYFWGYWFSFFEAEGLPDSAVYAVEVDALGNIWFGTDAGLVLYDGDTTWTAILDSLPDPRVREIRLNEADSIMWVGTLGGLAAYETGLPYPHSAWRTYTMSSTGDSLGSDEIYSIYPDTASSTIWLGTVNGAFRFAETDKIP